MAEPSPYPEIYDYLIVGGGAAGCVLANRLSADGRYTVCLLEAGPPDRNLFIHIPAGFIKLAYDDAYTWQFKTEPGPGIQGRRIPTTQGKTLGGSSSINGFNYVRGQREDYDSWRLRGNAGWSYAEVLPYFKRSETRLGRPDLRYRGASGPLKISDCDWRHPLCDGFIAAARELGVPDNDDYNGATQEGAGYYQRWIFRGRRQSTAVAFLHPASGRPNLHVKTHAQVTHVVLEGHRAVGVEWAEKGGGGRHRIRAAREVILCAGAANTPKLLMLSGIGPEDELARVGVPLVQRLPGVGQNLQDHFMVRSVCRVQGAVTLNEMARGVRLLGQIARWVMGKPSILSISPSVAYAFCKSQPDMARADLQFHFTPGSYREGVAGLLDDFPGMTLGFYQLRPHSVGAVTLKSNNPLDSPLIQPNYLTDKRDEAVVIAALRMSRALLHGQSLQRYVARDEFPPASAISDADLLASARARGGTAWHLMGTCRMGPREAADAVVDPALRVIGIEGLRVADASVMPSMPSGNTQIPTLMIAEKAADLILGRPVPESETG